LRRTALAVTGPGRDPSHDRGQPMRGSTLVRDPEFQDRVVAETRALLSTVPA
jgi:hypothetical protein